MEGEKLYFTLWEDDAVGSGHNKINEINRINPVALFNTVIDGKTEVIFNMAFYTQASRIADSQLAKGDKSEGKNHEYYITVDYYGKMVGESKNVNIKNPHSDNPIQRAIDQKYPDRNKSTEIKPNKNPPPPPVKPKKDTFKAPITTKAKTKAADPQGKILSVEFVDLIGRPYIHMKFGTLVKAKILSKNMKGKTIKLKIWEHDQFPQLVYENNYILNAAESYVTIDLTKQMRKKGDDLLEGNEQEYFLEIEYAFQSIDSSVINVNDDAPLVKVVSGNSLQGVKKQEKAKQKTQNNINKC